MLTLMLITKRPQVARHAYECGVKRIFVDMEILGKHARQGHLNTVISDHTLEDVAAVRQAVPGAELMVRVNPLHSGTKAEVDGALSAGADLLMLPMFETARELGKFSEIVDGRVGIVPLVETRGAAVDIARVARVPGLHEVFIGLNDLHLSLGLKFMFQLLANGTVERLIEQIRETGVPYGFGGIARVGEGVLPARLVLGEHARLRSRSVILSRAFHKGNEQIDQDDDFRKAIAAVRACETELDCRSHAQIWSDRGELRRIVDDIVRDRAEKLREAA
jgi:hypothetical protein